MPTPTVPGGEDPTTSRYILLVGLSFVAFLAFAGLCFTTGLLDALRARCCSKSAKAAPTVNTALLASTPASTPDPMTPQRPLSSGFGRAPALSEEFGVNRTESEEKFEFHSKWGGF